MLRHALAALTLGVVAAVAAPAAAQPIFADPTDATVTLVREVPGPPIAVDAEGYAYYGPRWASSNPNRQVTCMDPSAGLDAEQHGVWLSVIQPTTLMPGGYNGGGYAATAQLPDFSGLGVIAFRGPEVRIARIDCPTAAANTELGAGWTELGHWTLDDDVPWLGVTATDPAMRASVAPDGAWCFEVPAGLRCFVPGDAPRFELRVDLAEVAAGITLDPGHELATLDPTTAQRGELAPLVTTWTLRATTYAADGSVFFIATATLSGRQIGGYYVSVELPHVVLRRPDGSYDLITGPASPGQNQPVVKVGSLRYDPALDAVLAGPVTGIERVRGLEVAPTASGTGFWVFPVAEPGRYGWLSLTRAALRSIWCGTVACNPGLACSGGQVTTCSDFGSIRLVDLPGARVGLTRRHGRGPEHALEGPVETGYRDVGLYAADWDDATLDLDDDGLTAIEEAALGSSDFDAFSDDVLVDDLVEARFAGTDPADPFDDPAPLPPTNVRYVPSGLVRRILPADIESLGWTHSAAPDGPLCGAAACVLKDRVTRVPIPEELRASATRQLVMARDGRSLVAYGDGRLRRLSLPGGEVDDLLDRASLGAIIPASTAPYQGVVRVELLPVDDALVWLSVNVPTGWSDEASLPHQDDFRVYAVHDGVADLVYDQQRARCDSGLGSCDPDWGVDRPLLSSSGTNVGGVWTEPNDLGGGQYARMFDWLPALGRLVIVVPGTWDRYLVALHPSEPPAVVASGRRLAQASRDLWLPKGQIGTGHGDFLFWADTQTIDSGGYGHYARIFGLQSPWLTEHPLSWIEGFGRSHHVFWGDIVVTSDGQGEPWELVRYQGGNAPGDVLALLHPAAVTGVGEAAMLYRSGPRGGLAPTLGEPEPGLDGVWGMDLGDDGRLCFARRDAEEVGWLESPAAQAFTPGPELARWKVAAPVDCRVLGDGGTLVLQAEPARLLRYDTPWSDPVVVETLTGGTPQQLVDLPGGEVDVLYEEDGIRGRLHLADGRTIEVRDGEDFLRVDGAPIALTTAAWQATPPALLPASWRWRAVMAQRPDGLVVLIPAFAEAQPGETAAHFALAIDVDAREVWALASTGYAASSPAALTTVPGGDAGDPWTGGPPAAGPPDGPPTPEIPSQPEPSGGATIPPARGGGTCAGGGAGGAAWPIAVGLVALLATRRRRSLRSAAGGSTGITG